MSSLNDSNDQLRRSYSMPTTPTVSSRENYQSAAAAAPKISSSSSSSLALAPVRTAKSEDVTPTTAHSSTPSYTPTSSATTTTTTAPKRHQHKLDRFGFILNMDSRGNIGQGSGSEDYVAHYDGTSASPGQTPLGAAAAAATTTRPTTMSTTHEAPFTEAEVARTARRTVKWEVMLSKWPVIITRRRALLKKRLRKGIPDPLRATVWPLLCRVDEQMQQHPGLYRELVEQSVGVVSSNGSSTTTAATTITSLTSSNNATDTARPTNKEQRKWHSKSKDTTARASGGLGAVEEVVADARATAEAARRAQQEEPPPSPTPPRGTVKFHHSKSFKNIQETIERDIHRTFPRHSLFYSNGETEDGGGDDGDAPHDAHPYDENDSASAESSDLAQGMCGTNEISSMIRELELTHRSVPVPPPPPSSSSTRGSDPLPDDGQWIPTGNAHGDRIHRLKILEDAGGQARLRRVLKAYSTYDREIGYCQGMNFIAAMFLTVVTEEKAFWMLVGTCVGEPKTSERCYCVFCCRGLRDWDLKSLLS
jgi:Rab-GTPase-TBC domain